MNLTIIPKETFECNVTNDELNDALDIEYNKNIKYRLILNHTPYMMDFRTCAILGTAKLINYIFNLRNEETRLSCLMTLQADFNGNIKEVKNDISDDNVEDIIIQLEDQNFKLPKFTPVTSYIVTL